MKEDKDDTLFQLCLYLFAMLGIIWLLTWMDGCPIGSCHYADSDYQAGMEASLW